jgi:hypothetical protein
VSTQHIRLERSVVLETVKQRNIDHITYCANKYDFGYTAEQILNFANIFVQPDVLKKTIRLFGETKEKVVVEKTDSKGKVKTTPIVQYKKIILYSLTQRSQKSLMESQIIDTFRDLYLIALFHTELKHIGKLEESESKVTDVINVENIFDSLPKIKI